ncbi:S-adenosylmethionine:tRNA ribosyltransferase-isomerase [Blastomonas sp. UPD001]|uniref:S-adenosylmethionine:tRNA ribosyltransferase-isomerase n=1 Tax=Blastomonas sp. UPD001 TaxID=2217673 RepID=UPI00256FAAFC|nr:S-adenosylmethionine:tRNA ribosyltransferase-isomerase [Blastomonas sp. UPD001]
MVHFAGKKPGVSACNITETSSPKLNLFMLVSALMGLDVMKAAYAHAIANEYRFYSYGDSSLLLP